MLLFCYWFLFTFSYFSLCIRRHYRMQFLVTILWNVVKSSDCLYVNTSFRRLHFGRHGTNVRVRIYPRKYWVYMSNNVINIARRLLKTLWQQEKLIGTSIYFLLSRFQFHSIITHFIVESVNLDAFIQSRILYIFFHVGKGRKSL